MACLRMTLLRPQPGRNDEIQGLLEELDEALAGARGLVLSFVTHMDTARLGRVSLWHSREDANHEATREHILSLRSRLRSLSMDTQEVLLEVKSGHVPQELIGLLAGDLDVEATGDLAEAEIAQSSPGS